MAQILLKNTSDPGRVPTHLAQGEIAINTADGTMFYSDGAANNIKQFGVSSSYALTASFAVSSSRAVSSSFATTSSFVTGSNVYGPFGSNSIISSSFAISSSRAVSSSYALTASYALNGGGGGGTPGGSTTQIQYNNAGAFAGSSNLTYDGASLRITGSLKTSGSITSSADATINGLTIGRGGGNISTNTALGYQALSSSAGGENIAIGYDAGKYHTGQTSTIIGTYQAPDLTNFNTNGALNIGKSNLPHFWAPPTLRVDPTTNDKILSIDSTQYSAAFIDYNLENETQAMRAGTLKIIWKIDGTYRLTEEATDSIGDTVKYYFTTSISGGIINVTLFNDDSTYNVKINRTCRLLIRPTS